MVTYGSEVPRPHLILGAQWPLFPHASSLIIIILTIFMQNLTSFKNWWNVPLFKNETKARLLAIHLQLLHCPDLVCRFYCFWARGAPSSSQQVWALPERKAVFHPIPSTMWCGKEDERMALRGFHLSKIAVMESRMWKNVMATKKSCDLWKESRGHLLVRQQGLPAFEMWELILS